MFENLFAFNGKEVIPEPLVTEASFIDVSKEAMINENYIRNEVFPEKEAAFKTENFIIEEWFDGEKTYGELGNPINYTPKYELLAARSWQAYAENDICKIIINAYVEWMIGTGLNIQYEPMFDILKDEGYMFSDGDKKEISRKVEGRYRLYNRSTEVSHSKMHTETEIRAITLKQATVGGDCLQIFRVEKRGVTIEIVDGRDIKDPDRAMMAEVEKRGNKCILGVEVAPSGEHIAYYVHRQDKMGFPKITRVARLGEKTGRIQAVMCYGSIYRIGEVRGMPLLSASLEKLSKIERYIEAIVGGEEQRANIPWFFEHNHFSTGEDPMAKELLRTATNGQGAKDLSFRLDQAARKVAAVTNNTVHNLPIGVTMKSIESSQSAKFTEFVDGNFIFICASVPMPYEVALIKFVNSYSASRMATQTWQHIINTKRKYIQEKEIFPYFELFMYDQILKGKINLRGYLRAISDDDVILKMAFLNARFIGANVPQADPTKDTKAYILQLAHGLITHEQITESLGNGEYAQNIIRLGEEFKEKMQAIPEKFITLFSETGKAELPNEPKTKEVK